MSKRTIVRGGSRAGTVKEGSARKSERVSLPGPRFSYAISSSSGSLLRGTPARTQVPAGARDADAEVSGIFGEDALVRALQAPRRARRQRPSHGVPGRKPDAGPRFRRGGDL